MTFRYDDPRPIMERVRDMAKLLGVTVKPKEKWAHDGERADGSSVIDTWESDSECEVDAEVLLDLLVRAYLGGVIKDLSSKRDGVDNQRRGHYLIDGHDVSRVRHLLAIDTGWIR